MIHRYVDGIAWAGKLPLQDWQATFVSEVHAVIAFLWPLLSL